MTKDQICIDLSQCTHEQRKEIYKTLKEAGEALFRITEEYLSKGYYGGPYLMYDGMAWAGYVENTISARKILSFEDFIAFFKPKSYNPFQKGDKVYCHEYGWGEVIAVINIKCEVKFSNSTIFMRTTYLSFTEYTLEGFTQERPIDYEQMAKNNVVGWVWDDLDEAYKVEVYKVGKLMDYKKNSKYPFRTLNGHWQNFLPLTDSEKEVLSKNELFKKLFQ